MFQGPYPRKLEVKELKILSRVLPEDKPGYNKYNKWLSEYYLVSKGNSDNSLIISKDQFFLNTAPFITHVLAAGSFVENGKEINVVVHEEIEETIEIEIDIDESLKPTADVIYSDWKPGMKAPGDNSYIRQVDIQLKEYILVIAPAHKKTWLYVDNTGVNHFIPTGSFYSSLCMVKKIRDPEVVLKPELLFRNLDTYTDNELISAFYLYNNNAKRFRIEFPVSDQKIKKKGFFSKIFQKEGN